MAFLSSITKRSGPNTPLRDVSDVARLERINRSHLDDFAIQLALARMYYRMRDLVKAEEACDRAIKANGFTRARSAIWKVAAARNLRLRILSELGRGREAIQDAKAILNDQRSKDAPLIDAVLALASEEPEALKNPMSLPAIAAASVDQLIRLGSQLSLFPGMNAEAATIVEDAILKGNSESLPEPTDAQLVLIAGKRFESAVRVGDAYTVKNDINVSFNTAVAAWGRDGAPDPARWQHVYELFEQFGPKLGGEPNWEQCRALTYAVLRRIPEMEFSAEEARRLVHATTGREFSCWTYNYVGKDEFEAHLDGIVAFGNGRGSQPPAVQPTKS